MHIQSLSLLVIGKMQTTKLPSLGKWSQPWYIQGMECHSAVKNNDVGLLYTYAWNDVQDMLINEKGV